jgi:error-prone DNA polymerase
MVDASDQLYALCDDMLSAPLARADHVNTPLAGRKPPSNKAKESVQPRDIIDPLPTPKGHPRDHRIIPKSRDFH